MGIQFLDSSSAALVRPVIKSCRVFGNGGTNYFTDSIHVSSDGTLSGGEVQTTTLTVPAGVTEDTTYKCEILGNKYEASINVYSKFI